MAAGPPVNLTLAKPNTTAPGVAGQLPTRLVISDAGRQLDLALIDATTSAFQPDQVAPTKMKTSSMSERSHPIVMFGMSRR